MANLKNNKLNIFSEGFRNRKLIWKLAKNDFKKRYAGSYLGVVWGMVQPLVTVVLYFLVFGLIFPSQRSSGSEVPFVLFLTAGLVPWFFFNEGLTTGTNGLIEYNYLVKKVVFNISILPIIRAVAAIFTHLFFIVVLLIMASIYGYYPSFYSLQVLYYSLCIFVLILGISYATSAVCVFFRDLTQLITIILQVLMWGTPIMWDLASFGNETVKKVLMINPLVYIINGYRESVYGKVWFFEHGWYTLYFWCFAALLLFLGTRIFKRLRVHFSDVL